MPTSNGTSHVGRFVSERFDRARAVGLLFYGFAADEQVSATSPTQISLTGDFAQALYIFCVVCNLTLVISIAVRFVALWVGEQHKRCEGILRTRLNNQFDPSYIELDLDGRADLHTSLLATLHDGISATGNEDARSDKHPRYEELV
jgi:hypothetical protein